MEGNEFVWIVSIIIGMTLLGWLVLDWLESAQRWDTYDMDPTLNTPLGRSEQPAPDALDTELELMLCYPLDPFAPALFWRPQPQDQWVEAQEATESAALPQNVASSLGQSPAASPGETG